MELICDDDFKGVSSKADLQKQLDFKTTAKEESSGLEGVWAGSPHSLVLVCYCWQWGPPQDNSLPRNAAWQWTHDPHSGVCSVLAPWVGPRAHVSQGLHSVLGLSSDFGQVTSLLASVSTFRIRKVCRADP